MTSTWADERVRFLRYTTPERWPSFERMPVGADLQADVLAAMLGCSRAAVGELRADLARGLEAGADELLAAPDYRRALVALPFTAGSRIVALGDSLTADRLGWFELIAASLRMSGRRDLELHNLGLSGDTTADAIERFDLLAASRPTHVLLFLGTNDARAHGRSPGPRMVSPGETRRNLAALRELITGELGASVHLITPPPGDQRLITPFFAHEALRWDAAALDEVAAVVRDLDAACIDVAARMKRRGLAGLLEADGVHLTPLGQRFVAETVVRQLAAT